LGRRLLLALFLLAALYNGWDRWSHRTIHHPAGVLAPDEPLQQDYATPQAAFDSGGYAVQPLAAFSLVARVLSRSDYHWDTLSGLVPTDLALGWGRMSDSAVLDQLSIDQSDRFFFWSTRVFPIPRREIETHAANMHLIPADPAVRAALRRVRPGAVVHLEGQLVEVHAPQGWTLRSSLTRDDTGPGACEVVWVQRLELQ